LSRIAGVDEAGRGALFGPVMAAAVILDPDSPPPPGIQDSKKLTPAVRSRVSQTIKEQALAWAVASASHHEIDRLNILQATLLAMQRALMALKRKPTLVRVDGDKVPSVPWPTVAIVGGDKLFAEIAAASILAKVSRDAHLEAQEKNYSGYGLCRHKGYATSAHLEALERLGPTPLHRRSFAPVKRLLKSRMTFKLE